MQLLGNGDSAKAFALLTGVADQKALERLAAPGLTFREGLALLGQGAESAYLLHRFSDPSYLTTAAIARAVAQAVIANSFVGEARILDLCGGTGHLTRVLSAAEWGSRGEYGSRGRSPSRVCLADLELWKVYLAKRFIAPGCDAICCNANEPLPFKPSQFRLVVCADAFHYIWSKRQLAAELQRACTSDGAVLLPHLHNSLEWNPSQGLPLSPEGYARLFPSADTRLFAEQQFYKAAISGSAIDLSMGLAGTLALPATPDLASAAELVLVSSADASVYKRHELAPLAARRWAMNPLYKPCGNGVWTLTFPSADYESEHGACLDYLPKSITLTREQQQALEHGMPAPVLDELAASRVVLDLPDQYG
jgi:SAM-dependent methyltransferase